MIGRLQTGGSTNASKRVTSSDRPSIQLYEVEYLVLMLLKEIGQCSLSSANGETIKRNCVGFLNYISTCRFEFTLICHSSISCHPNERIWTKVMESVEFQFIVTKLAHTQNQSLCNHSVH